MRRSSPLVLSATITSALLLCSLGPGRVCCRHGMIGFESCLCGSIVPRRAHWYVAFRAWVVSVWVSDVAEFVSRVRWVFRRTLVDARLVTLTCVLLGRWTRGRRRRMLIARARVARMGSVLHCRSRNCCESLRRDQWLCTCIGVAAKGTHRS